MNHYPLIIDSFSREGCETERVSEPVINCRLGQTETGTADKNSHTHYISAYLHSRDASKVTTQLALRRRGENPRLRYTDLQFINGSEMELEALKNGRRLKFVSGSKHFLPQCILLRGVLVKASFIRALRKYSS